MHDLLSQTFAQINTEFSRPIQEAKTLHSILADHYWAVGGMNEYECAREVLALYGLEATNEAVDAVAREVRRTDDFGEMAMGVRAVVGLMKRDGDAA